MIKIASKLLKRLEKTNPEPPLEPAPELDTEPPSDPEVL